jgi:hypothetical protein
MTELARIAYTAYRDSLKGKVPGADDSLPRLPEYDNLEKPYQAAWEAAIEGVKAELTSAEKPVEEK